MTSPTQVLASSGTSFASRYEEFGGYSGFLQPNSDRVFAVVISEPNVGKSHFAESDPNGMRIDCDRCGAVNRTGKAVTVPKLLDDKNRVISITWEWLQKLKHKLIEDAAKNLPRPKTLYVDTLDSLVEIAKDFVVRENQATYFSDFTGNIAKQRYGRMYDLVFEYLYDLYKAGYSVWCFTHSVEKVIPIEENNTIKMDVTLGDGLWSRIRRVANLIVYLDKSVETEKIKVWKKNADGSPILNSNGQPVLDKIINGSSVRVVKMWFHHPKLFQALTLKPRVGLPDFIVIPKEDGRKAFDDAYAAAISAEQESGVMHGLNSVSPS